MLQAFDCLLQVSVSAETAAKSKADEPFRYECLCCGEEVYVAAADSKKRAAHFRHRRGNSDKDCDLYLGSVGIAGALNAAKRRSHNRTDIYFDYEEKIFYTSISFTEETLTEYEKSSCVLELRSGFNEPPYGSVKIHHCNFAADSMVFFPLRLTSNECYLSITNTEYNYHYKILRDNGFPTFFRIPAGDNTDFKAKRIVTGSIYSCTSYYVLASNCAELERFHEYREHLTLGNIEEIDCLGSTMYGAILKIESIDAELIKLFAYFNYDLCVAEEVIPLWPPMWTEDGVLCSSQNRIQLTSSFELVPNSNTTCDKQAISQREDLYDLNLATPIDIRYGNINIHIESRVLQPLISPITIEYISLTTIDIPETERYFCVGNEGYRKLPSGKNRLTRSERVIKYRGNYPIMVCTYPQRTQKSRVAVLHDILTYYKVTTEFKECLIEHCSLSVIAQAYIEECRISKRINIRALEYIKAGKI